MRKAICSLAAAAFLASSMPSQVSAQSSGPFSFSGPSASSSEGYWLLPTAVALGFGLGLDDQRMRDILTGETLYGPTNYYWDVIVFWQLAAVSSAAPLFVQLGYYDHRGDVDRVVQPGGATFNTDGTVHERGVFVGAGVKARLDPNANPNTPTTTANAALSLGYGWQDFTAFGGGFTRDQESLFWRAEVGLDIPVRAGNSIFSINPGLVYTGYDGDDIDGSNLVGVLRVVFDF